MASVPPRQPTGRIAENGGRWPDLQWLLAPAAGCDCQLMALAMTDDAKPPVVTPVRKIAQR